MDVASPGAQIALLVLTAAWSLAMLSAATTALAAGKRSQRADARKVLRLLLRLRIPRNRDN